jgi:hypothetical protein
MEVWRKFKYNLTDTVQIAEVLPADGIGVTNLRRKKFRMTWFGFTPSFPPETKAVSGT